MAQGPSINYVRIYGVDVFGGGGGGGGSTLIHTNACKGGEGGLNMTKNTHFVRMFIENATISETLKDRRHLSAWNSLCSM